jgi:hypothetical protein
MNKPTRDKWRSGNDLLLAAIALVILWHPVVFLAFRETLWEPTPIGLVFPILVLVAILGIPEVDPRGRIIFILAAGQSLLIHFLPYLPFTTRTSLIGITVSAVAAYATAFFGHVFLPGLHCREKYERLFYGRRWEGPMTLSRALANTGAGHPCVILVTDKTEETVAMVLTAADSLLPAVLEQADGNAWVTTTSTNEEALRLAKELSTIYSVPIVPPSIGAPHS